MAAAAALRWAVNVAEWEPSAPAWDFLLALLPADERERVLRFVFRDDQKRALVSRLLQRRCVEVALGVPANEAQIARTKGNKPYLAARPRGSGAPNFNFNVSHEGAWVVLASEPLLLVGTDVAAPLDARRRRQGDGSTGPGRAKALEEIFESMSSSFTAEEWAAIRTPPDAVGQEAVFRRLWSLKEAYIKARGDGLAFPLDRCAFELHGGGDGGEVVSSRAAATLRVDGVVQVAWAFDIEPLAGGHWVSVARGPPTAAVDAWGGFTATMECRELGEATLADERAQSRPPFSVICLQDIVPAAQQSAFAETLALGDE